MKLSNDGEQIEIEDDHLATAKWVLLRDLRARFGTTQLTEAEITQFAFSRMSLMALRGAVDDAIAAIESRVREAKS